MVLDIYTKPFALEINRLLQGNHCSYFVLFKISKTTIRLAIRKNLEMGICVDILNFIIVQRA